LIAGNGIRDTMLYKAVMVAESGLIDLDRAGMWRSEVSVFSGVASSCASTTSKAGF